MRTSRFADEQMVAILREAERTSVAEVAKMSKISSRRSTPGARTWRRWSRRSELIFQPDFARTAMATPRWHCNDPPRRAEANRSVAYRLQRAPTAWRTLGHLTPSEFAKAGQKRTSEATDF